MILNNTHVQGIFLYKDDIEYEKGDFVVSGSSIYICTAKNPSTENNTVLGKDPSTDSENFTIYLGDSIKNIDEYFSYVNNPGEDVSGDKLLTAELLSQILNTYMIGFDEKGIIGEYIHQDTVGGSLVISNGLSKFVSGDANNILDTIIKTEEINNATLKISRSLEELKGIFPSQYIENTTSEEDRAYLILRQYTYTNGITEEDNDEVVPATDTIFRLQELIDPIQGLTAYRHARGVGGSENREWEIASWKTDYDYDFLVSIQKLKEAYIQAINELEEEKKNLKNYFRFKEITIEKTNSEIVLQCNDPDGENYIPVDSFTSQSCIITIITQLWDTNITISVDILDSYMEISPVLTYYLTDSSSLTILPPDRESEFYDKQVTVRVNNGNISNIYYREKYV